MHIPSYQIHNVLKVYSRQLTRARDQGSFGLASESKNSKNSIDPLGIDYSGKRAAILRRISADIVKKMTMVDSGKDQDTLLESSTPRAIQPEPAGETHAEDGQHVFVYNIIGKDLQKQGQKILETSSRRLMDCLNRLAERRDTDS